MEIYYPWCQYSADNSTGCIADWHAALSLWQHNPAKNHYGNAALYGHGQQFGPHDSVFNQLKSIQYSVNIVNKTFDIAELPLAMEEKPISAHDILMEHVTFSYTGKENVIHDINLAIPEKAFYALVGPSGGGKSTLARLVARFWDPTEEPSGLVA